MGGWNGCVFVRVVGWGSWVVLFDLVCLILYSLKYKKRMFINECDYESELNFNWVCDLNLIIRLVILVELILLLVIMRCIWSFVYVSKDSYVGVVYWWN